MKKVLYLLTIAMMFMVAGCFSSDNFNSKIDLIAKLKFVANNEKRAMTVVKNGIYIKGTTTILYTFPDFMELTSSQQENIFADKNAYIVYKDKYIDMYTFGIDINVTASSFLNGTNGVKPIVDESVIPSVVTTKYGVVTTSGTEAFRVTLTTIWIKNLPFKTTYNLGEPLDITGLVVMGIYSNESTKVESVTAGNITGFDSSKIGTNILTITIGGKTTVYQITVTQSTTTKFTVKFDSQGGTTVASQSVNSGEKAIQPSEPSKSGYTFGGWYKESGTINIWDFSSSIVTGEITLYAKWSTIIVPSTGFVLVPAGTTSSVNGSLTVSKDFYISKYETTQSEFNAMMGFNPSYFKGDVSNNPVETVTWYDAVAYCNAKSNSEGISPYYTISGITKTGNNIAFANVTENGGTGYRLPTSNEWEYAARGGKSGTGYTYSGSNTAGDVAWNADNSYPTNANNGYDSDLNGKLRGTHPVGTKAANELGINDMSGNVFEWCNDLYSGTDRFIKGGSWYASSYYGTVGVNSFAAPGNRNYYLGIRVVRTK